MATDPNDDVPPKPADSRKVMRGTARLAAVQALYQMDLTQTNTSVVIAEFTGHRFGEADGAYYDKADEPFFRDLVLGVVRAQRTVDPLIATHLAKGWRLARIDSILRAICARPPMSCTSGATSPPRSSSTNISWWRTPFSAAKSRAW